MESNLKTKAISGNNDNSVPGAPDCDYNPYLHVENNYIYNPLTDRTISPGEIGYEELQALSKGSIHLPDIRAQLRNTLLEQGWLIQSGLEQSSGFLLKYVSLEGHSACNQACDFCPVSVAPREVYFMPVELYEHIVEQLSAYKHTIEAVFMLNYNEPTSDHRFLDFVRIIKKFGLPPAVNTNGTGLTPDRVRALLEMGGLRYLSVNLSSMDRERYKRTRGRDHLGVVMRNLDYLKSVPLAPTMDIAVLGNGDEAHKGDYDVISNYFTGSQFNVRYFEIMNRAGHLPVGLKPVRPRARLCGCENLGSRPFQHLHITPQGKCVLCCEDYEERHVVGDLTKQTVSEVLTGPALAKLRRWVYGLEQSPDDFICKGCVFARSR